MQQQQQHMRQEKQLQECEQLLASAALACSAWHDSFEPSPAQQQQLLRVCRTLHTGLATRAAEAAVGGGGGSSSSSSSSSSSEALRLQGLLTQLRDQLRAPPVPTSVLHLHIRYCRSFRAEMSSRQQQHQPSRAGARRLPAAGDAHLVRFYACCEQELHYLFADKELHYLLADKVWS